MTMLKNGLKVPPLKDINLLLKKKQLARIDTMAVMKVL